MKTRNAIIQGVIVAFLTIILISCTDDINQAAEQPQQLEAMKIHFNVTKTEFDGQNSTRSANSTSAWNDGEIIYLRFATGGGVITGKAVYDAKTDDWTVQCDGNLSYSTNAKVEAYYFEQPTSTTSTKVRLSATKGVYHDADGLYSYTANGTLAVALTIRPMTSRIRFKGEQGTSITLFDGITSYEEFEIATGNFTSKSVPKDLYVGSNGYTSYIYGVFSNNESPKIEITIGTDMFVTSCSDAIFKTGESGWMNIPTKESLYGWEKVDPFVYLGFCPDANHPHQIEMTDGLYYACCNVGALSPLEYGNYYAWGETYPKASYDWSNYKWCEGTSTTLTKYCYEEAYGIVDNKTQLDLEDDAAHVNWGGSWRMPTHDEQKQLADNCSWTETSICGIEGYKVTGQNSNSIFLPHAGRYDGTDFSGGSGHYWSSSLNEWYHPTSAYELIRTVAGTSFGRSYGISIRPVTTGGNGHIRTFIVKGNGKSIMLNMRLVEAGTFQMGSSDSKKSSPVHNVTLTHDYYIGETEVTQGLWNAVMEQIPSSSSDHSWNVENGLGDNFPAYYISYEDCLEFIAKLNRLTGLEFRLPTEAEWEYAARGGNLSKGYIYAGSNTCDDVAWTSDNSNLSSHEVRTKAANELGLYDMSGNVYEWCVDWYDSYTSSEQADPVGPSTGTQRVYRGGGYGHPWEDCKITKRLSSAPTSRAYSIGFRLAMSF